MPLLPPLVREVDAPCPVCAKPVTVRVTWHWALDALAHAITGRVEATGFPEATLDHFRSHLTEEIPR